MSYSDSLALINQILDQILASRSLPKVHSLMLEWRHKYADNYLPVSAFVNSSLDPSTIGDLCHTSRYCSCFLGFDSESSIDCCIAQNKLPFGVRYLSSRVMVDMGNCYWSLVRESMET